MPEPHFVRRAIAADIDAILALYRELDELHRERHPELYPPQGIRRDRSSVETALADPQVGMFVARLGSDRPEVVSGFAQIRDVQTPDGRVLAPRRFGLVDDLAVATSARRHGLASALLAAAEDWARQRGLEALEVTVYAFNQPAQILYQSAGFETLRHYLRKTLDKE